MNGLDPEETRGTIERGQRVFSDVFGEPARGFLAPAWQRGYLGRPKGRHYDSRGDSRGGDSRGGDSRGGDIRADSRSAGLQAGLDFILGFFSLHSSAGQDVPLATWSWDCGRWGWLGHVGHGIGRLSHSLNRGVPTLAIHPRDLERGFWPTILRLTEELIDSGYEPTTAADLQA